jgi:hypothetical protein
VKKIIFITPQPLNERNLNRFHLLLFVKNGWKVNYWNVQNIFYQNEFHNLYAEYKIPKINNLKFTNIASLFREIFFTENSFYVDFLDNSFLSFILRKILYFKNNKRILIDSANYPAHDIRNLNLKLLLKKLKFFFFIKSIKILILIITRKIMLKFLNTNIFIHLVSGKLSRIRSEKLYGKGLQLKSHSFDYNIYLQNISKKKYLDKIVFIDQDWPLPFELAIRGGKKFVTLDNYWKSLNLFFDYLENKFNKEVIIARHPRANKNINISDKKILYNFTDQLIKNSFLNITHTSNAIQFALLYKKPLLIISTNELEQNQDTAAYSDILALSKSLNKNILNIDRFSEPQLLKEMNVNDQIYDEYINNYIKESGSKNLNTFFYLRNYLNSNSNT